MEQADTQHIFIINLLCIFSSTRKKHFDVSVKNTDLNAAKQKHFYMLRFYIFQEF